MQDSKGETAVLMSHLVPLVSGAMLVAACFDPGAANPSLSDPIGQQIGHIVSTPIYLTYLALTLGLLTCSACRSRTHRLAWWALDTTVITFLLVQGLKFATGLPRPSGAPSGFPSGHTTIAFALAWLILAAHPRLSPVWFGVAVAIGWSRMEIHAHFVYQVLTGAVLGSGLGWWVSRHPKGVLFHRCFR